jgi:hypothetical protein
MQRFTCLRKLFFCILMMALVVPSAWPQASTATSSGTVHDESGAVVPNASVTLTNTATNVALRGKSNDIGFYFFPGIIPGPYTLIVEAPGMQKFEGSMTVQTQQSAVVDVVLKVGQTTTAVSVQDVTPMLEVDNFSLGSTLERQRIEQLPINGRNVTNLLVTIPGMEGLRAMGTRAGSLEASLDGAPLVDRNSYGNSQKSQITYVQPGLDSIQEFTVESNAASARYSTPTSIVMTSKSGTNDFHGTAFETNRNNGYGVARARQDGNGGAPFLNRNEFGVSAGGPLVLPKIYNGKNKTFWFFGYEGLQNINSTTMSFYVPTQAERNGDFSGLVDANGVQTVIYNPFTTDPTTWARQPYLNNQIPVNQQNKLAQALMAATPLPNQPNINPAIAPNWIGPVSQPQKSWTTTTRIDHHFGDNDQFYGRYTQANYSRESEYYYGIPSTNPQYPFGTETVRAPNKSIALSYVHNFSPTFFNELLVSGSRQTEWDGTGQPGVDYAGQMGLPNMFHVDEWPKLNNAGFGGNYNFTGQSTNAYHSFYGILDDNATKIMGKHEIQFGFHYRYDQMNMLPDQQIASGSVDFGTGATGLYDPLSGNTSPQALPYTGDQLANFYLGVGQYQVQQDHAYFYLRQQGFAGYLQDKFRVTPRLTVNLGLRYEYNTPLREKNGMLTGFDLANHAIVTGTSLQKMYSLGYADPSVVNTYIAEGAKFETPGQGNSLPSGLMTSSKNDLGPRAGFAYRALDGSKSFVVRGGYSISYFHIPLYSFGARMRKNAPLTATYTESLTDGAYSPDGYDNLGLRTVPTIFAGTPSDINAIPRNGADSIYPGAANASFFAPNQPDPRVQNWNLTLEKEIMANTIVRAGYIGNHSSNLDTLDSLNNSTPAYIWYTTKGVALPTGNLSDVATNAYDQQVYGRVEEWTNWGRGNSNGIQLELQRRYSKGYGYQVIYVMDNNLASGGQGYNVTINPVNQYLPGTVPTDDAARNDYLNYRRDTTVPKHHVSWNWVVDVPVGKGKPILGNAGKFLDRVVGGWQIAGLGSLRSTYFTLPSSGAEFPTGNPVEVYGYKYKIQDCTSGTCQAGYLWWNGFISPNLINRKDASGNPTGIMMDAATLAAYKPATTYLIPWGTTTPPANMPAGTNLQSYWNTNTEWVKLADGSVKRTTWAGVTPFNNQFLPSVLQWSVDASLFKNIPITERFRLRLQLDAFNVLNHPGSPNSVSSSGLLSEQYSGNSARTLQLSGRVSW